MYKNIEIVDFMSQKILKKGLDCEITMSDNGVRVRILDRLTDMTLGVAEDKTAEGAILEALTGIAQKNIVYSNEKLTVL